MGKDFHKEPNDIVKEIEDNYFDDKKKTNLESITVNSTSHDVLSKNNYIDDELNKHTILRINQTLEKSLKVSFGSVLCNLTKYDKIQITETNIIKIGNTDVYTVPLWKKTMQL